MTRQAKRFGLFGRAPAYAIFWSARTVSLFEDAIANVALVDTSLYSRATEGASNHSSGPSVHSVSCGDRAPVSIGRGFFTSLMRLLSFHSLV